MRVNERGVAFHYDQAMSAPRHSPERPTRGPARQASARVTRIPAVRPRLRDQLRELLRRTREQIEARRSIGGTSVTRAADQPPSVGSLEGHWESVVQGMLRRSRAVEGNSVDVFVDGDAMFGALWQAIDAAKTRVWVECYTVEPDRVGRRTIAAMTEAARRGCDTLLFVDAVGSNTLTEEDCDELLQAGGRICVYNPRSRWLRRSPLNRNHRKLVVIDASVAFVGGMNISEHYAGPRHGLDTFRDCQLRVQGPVCRLLERSLATMVRHGEFAHCPLPSLEPEDESAASEAAGHVIVQVLESSAGRGQREIQRELRVAIDSARVSVDLATPYFVPPRSLQRRLKEAAQRGVAVRLITAGRSDVPIVALAARHIYDDLLRSGVQIFEFDEAVLHAKVAIIDSMYAMVGSFNLDRWSNSRNLEINVGLISPDVLARLHDQFEAWLAGSHEISLDGHRRRLWVLPLIEWIAYQLMRL